MSLHLPTSPSSTSSTNPTPSSDPIHTWWESISKARSQIHLLSTLLPDKNSLSTLADTDQPARALLNSLTAYKSLTSILTSPSSGSKSDPICQFLYDTYISSDPDLRLVILSYLPVLIHTYLHRIHHPSVTSPSSLSGFEAVLLSLYSSETKLRNGKPVTVSIPDLAFPSLYHSPALTKSGNASGYKITNKIISAPLEPQVAVKSTKRACIVGVALGCYYKYVSVMPSFSKIDFCNSVTVWAGEACPCVSELDDSKYESFENGHCDRDDNVENVEERIRDLEIGDGDEEGEGDRDGRIPLPWELLQPVLRILGHCLLGPLNAEEVKDAASVAVRRLYARATHDLVPQAILATRSLIQLDKGAREAAVSNSTASVSGSNVNTPSKAKKPEILLVSK